MDKHYNHSKYEEKIYKKWEDSGAFKPNPKAKKPFTILMPPPNANASLHAGHAMYTVDDILTRFKRMQGFSAVWIPGMDHAGFETQYVYEKHLSKEGKSRLDFDRKTLHQNIEKFVKENSGLIYKQMKRLGFSADWEKSTYAADPEVIDFVYKTFIKMEKEGYVYRDNYIVNYCPHCGTSLAELEVIHQEQIDSLYFVRYYYADSPKKYEVVATTRPEPIYVDTHLAINPKNKKTKHLKGKKLLNPMTGKVMEIVEDSFVDPEFGTGIVKLTPAHDHNDFEVAKKLSLPIVRAVGNDGRMIGGPSKGKKVFTARKEAVEILTKSGHIEKIDDKYEHSVISCYKCKRVLEPTLIPNWFIKVDKLKKRVKEVVEKDEVKFFPKKHKKHMLSWLDIMHDWPISRQIVWCIRIPVWYSADKNPNIEVSFIDKDGNKQIGKISDFNFEEVEKGLQTVSAPIGSKYIVGTKKPQGKYLPETDTFDTWFSSGQWPLVTLKGKDLDDRYPTDFMGTLSDILKFWVSRMILFSLYIKDEIPFKNVYLWSMVADKHGKKMSKSKGNVINPIEVIDKYGADALRMSLIYGIPAGSKAVFAEEKVKGMRNFANKIWNIGRYLEFAFADVSKTSFDKPKKLEKEDQEILNKLNKLITNTTKNLEKYKLNIALEEIYEFAWHQLADKYIENTKDRAREKDENVLYTLRYTYLSILKLLHPFAPFVTESIWQEIGEKDLLITSNWPTT